jgi:hypothetical protein
MALTQVASDFATNLTGILDATLMSNINTAILATQNTYASSGIFQSNVYTFEMQLLSENAYFVGICVGPGKMISGGVSGTVYTANDTTLYSTASSFCMLNMASYTAVIFFDNSFNYLGCWLAGFPTGITLPAIISGGKFMSYP